MSQEHQRAPGRLPAAAGVQSIADRVWRRVALDLGARPPGNLAALDGMRALACTSIVFFHCALFTGVFSGSDPSLELRVLRLLGNGAWAGVDIFFVLSGFLMGRILIRELTHAGHLHYRRFYLRRIFRIFPAYYLVLTIAVFVIARYNVGNVVFYSGARSWQQLRAGAWTNYLYLNNYVDLGTPNVLSWGWSLCVEEHFYLLLPVLLALTFRARRTRTHALLLAAYALLPVLGRAWQYAFDPTVVQTNTFYYFSHNRLDQLFLGVCIGHAYVTARGPFARTVARLEPWPWIGGLLCIATVWVVGGLQHAGPFTVIGQLFVIAVGTGLVLANGLFLDNWLTRFLGHPLWYPVARVSYGTYLIHPFVLFWVLTRVRVHTPLQEIHAWSLASIFVLVLGTSLAIASAMFVIVERPLLDLGHRLGRAPRDDVAASYAINNEGKGRSTRRSRE